MNPEVAERRDERPEIPAALRPHETAIIQSKIAVPPLATDAVDRPRLERLLADLIDNSQGVFVTATAGAGKTTAVAAAAALVGRPVAWLTVDRTDTAPGRLVAYLEAALAAQLPDLRGVATGAVGAGIPHAEAAGLLADAIGDRALVLVLDELDRLGTEG